MLRKGGSEISFERGGRYPLDALRREYAEKKWQRTDAAPIDSVKETGTGGDAFWDKVHAIEKSFQGGLEKNVPEDVTSALLELDGTIWKAQQELENAEFISQAREILRDMLALLGTRLSSSPKSEAEYLAPIAEQLLELREQFRKQKKWQEADEVRKCLTQANIVIEDTKYGSRWRLKN